MHASDFSMPQAILSDFGIQAALRADNLDLWDETLQNAPYAPTLYSGAFIDYQNAYWTGNCPEYIDISVIILHNNKPCGIWPVSLMKTKNVWTIGSLGEKLLQPIFIAGTPLKTRKKVVSACLNTAIIIAHECKQTTLDTQNSFFANTGLGEWHQKVIQTGGAVSVHHHLFTDLTADLATIKSTLRKSYKSLISSGEKLWTVETLDRHDTAIWTEYRLLHRQIAGKATRSLESWEKQLEAIEKQNAFLVYLRDQDMRMIGGGLFHFTKDEGLYAVGAYDRNLFDKPLGHVVQFRAIQELKSRGVRWYKIGYLPRASDTPQPSTKEISIGEFKQGFASHLFPCFSLSLPIGIEKID